MEPIEIALLISVAVIAVLAIIALIVINVKASKIKKEVDNGTYVSKKEKKNKSKTNDDTKVEEDITEKVDENSANEKNESKESTKEAEKISINSEIIENDDVSELKNKEQSSKNEVLLENIIKVKDSEIENKNDYSKLTVLQLKKELEKQEISFKSNMKKQELIDSLVEAAIIE